MQTKAISLSELDKKRLENLAEMINIGSEEFTKKLNLDSLSLKQELLYLNFAAVNNYVEAIFKLCLDMRPHSAIVILRSIVEAFINTAYILTHNSDKRAVLFSMEDSYNRNGLANEIIIFLNKHPQFEKDSFNRETFKEGLIKTTEEIEFYKKRFKLNYKNKKDFEKQYHVKLLERAKAVDRRIRKPDFEHTYILVYRYFSEFGHLSMRGLDHFIKKDVIQGNHEIMASQDNEVDHIISTTYTMYLFFLNELKKRKMLNKEFPIKRFNKYWNDEFNSSASKATSS